MQYVIRLFGFGFDGAFVQEYDPDAYDGRGHLKVTGDPGRALTFPTQAEAVERWRAQSTVQPLRADGRPNCPLSAFTVQIEPVAA
jgi:hypothetical protein